MNIITNDKLVRRNTRLAQITSFSGLAILIGGMVISFTRQDLVSLSFAALILGFILSQLGMYYMNRWGRRPRPDELLNQALKGLDSKYTLYHYTIPAAHVLVGPAGVWALVTKHQRGTITFERGRWRQSGGGFLNAYMRIFAQEGIGRPDIELTGEVEGVKNYLQKRLELEELPEIQAALVFTSDKANLDIDQENPPPAPTIALGKLKDFIRKTAKTKPISMDKLNQIQELINSV